MPYMRTVQPGTGGYTSRMTSGAPSYGGRPGMRPVGAAQPGEAMGRSAVPRSYTRGRSRSGGDVQSRLASDIEGFSNELLPVLQRGLRSTRSRFGGGGIRSGGAQRAEELAFERLYANPLQNRIQQNARFSLEHELARDQHSLNREAFEEEIRQFDLEQKARRRAGQGRLVGTVLGGIGGFLVGGPGGAAVGASIGSGLG